jgi:hypothetical protein
MAAILANVINPAPSMLTRLEPIHRSGHVAGVLTACPVPLASVEAGDLSSAKIAKFYVRAGFKTGVAKRLHLPVPGWIGMEQG